MFKQIVALHYIPTTAGAPMGWPIAPTTIGLTVLAGSNICNLQGLHFSAGLSVTVQAALLPNLLPVCPS